MVQSGILGIKIHPIEEMSTAYIPRPGWEGRPQFGYGLPLNPLVFPPRFRRKRNRPTLCAQVPFRRVKLTNDTTFDLYDTSGPQVMMKGALGCRF